MSYLKQVLRVQITRDAGIGLHIPVTFPLCIQTASTSETPEKPLLPTDLHGDL